MIYYILGFLVLFTIIMVGLQILQPSFILTDYKITDINQNIDIFNVKIKHVDNMKLITSTLIITIIIYLLFVLIFKIITKTK